ncbi:MAG: phosphate ABC transporter permease PstA [Fimbriimonadales bacterium]
MNSAYLSTNRLTQRDAARGRSERRWIALWCGAATLLLLVVFGILGYIFVRGFPALSWDFLSSPPTKGMTSGGIWPMIRGTLLLIIGTGLVVLPLGVLSGVHLCYYARDGRAVRILRSCLVALAGTPSIVFGLFGLAVFVIAAKLGTSLIAGWLTLAVFSLPPVILATEAALRTVPISFTDAGEALGLPKWTTIWRIAIPAAMPSILTGLVLSAGRAAGEAPPILLTCGIFFSTAKLSFSLDALQQPVANLAYHLAEGYRQGGQIPEKNVWGTCLTLVLIVLSINLLAIYARWKTRRQKQW